MFPNQHSQQQLQLQQQHRQQQEQLQLSQHAQLFQLQQNHTLQGTMTIESRKKELEARGQQIEDEKKKLQAQKFKLACERAAQAHAHVQTQGQHVQVQALNQSQVRPQTQPHAQMQALAQPPAQVQKQLLNEINLRNNIFSPLAAPYQNKQHEPIKRLVNTKIDDIQGKWVQISQKVKQPSLVVDTKANRPCVKIPPFNTDQLEVRLKSSNNQYRTKGINEATAGLNKSILRPSALPVNTKNPNSLKDGFDSKLENVKVNPSVAKKSDSNRTCTYVCERIVKGGWQDLEKMICDDPNVALLALPLPLLISHAMNNGVTKNANDDINPNDKESNNAVTTVLHELLAKPLVSKLEAKARASVVLTLLSKCPHAAGSLTPPPGRVLPIFTFITEQSGIGADGSVPPKGKFGFEDSDKLKIVEALVQAYPDSLQTLTSDGKSPLHTAIINKSPVSIVGLLSEAYPRATRWQDDSGWLPIHHACVRTGSLKSLKVLLGPNPESIRATTGGSSECETPLNLAAKSVEYYSENWEIVKYLAEKLKPVVVTEIEIDDDGDVQVVPPPSIVDLEPTPLANNPKEDVSHYCEKKTATEQVANITHKESCVDGGMQNDAISILLNNPNSRRLHMLESACFPDLSELNKQSATAVSDEDEKLNFVTLVSDYQGRHRKVLCGLEEKRATIEQEFTVAAGYYSTLSEETNKLKQEVGEMATKLKGIGVDVGKLFATSNGDVYEIEGFKESDTPSIATEVNKESPRKPPYQNYPQSNTAAKIEEAKLEMKALEDTLSNMKNIHVDKMKNLDRDNSLLLKVENEDKNDIVAHMKKNHTANMTKMDSAIKLEIGEALNEMEKHLSKNNLKYIELSEEQHSDKVSHLKVEGNVFFLNFLYFSFTPCRKICILQSKKVRNSKI
mmetsp:Transcript_41461/g.48344  ORF Transcript_41461/g.48344 Transcript_41461/m.48344 type:complete len:904 (+) Transcript_41461:96-2807(+)